MIFIFTFFIIAVCKQEIFYQKFFTAINLHVHVHVHVRFCKYIFKMKVGIVHYFKSVHRWSRARD